MSPPYLYPCVCPFCGIEREADDLSACSECGRWLDDYDGPSDDDRWAMEERLGIARERERLTLIDAGRGWVGR